MPRWGSGGERDGPGAEPEVICTPGPGIRDHHQRTREYLPLGTNLEVVVGSKLHFIPLFFFFFFWVGQGGGSAAETTKSRRGEVVSRPLHSTDLWNGAPSSGTACSLELSLPSPAGIWFKTPLPVGGANTAHCFSKERWSPSPQEKVPVIVASEAGSVGVASGWSDRGIPTKPAGGLLSGVGSDDPRLRLTRRAVPDRPKRV